MARPTAWTPEKIAETFPDIIDRICDGESVRSVLKDYGTPTYATFLGWIANDKELEKQYARAMEIRAENLFDEIIDISDEKNADISVSEDGKIRVDGETVQRSRLRVDARKWALSKMLPKKYGDKIDVTSDGEKLESTVTIFQLPDNGRNEDN